ncbi:hypothetical protein NLI96_g8294 [Meripilus lineatus]|uniref:Uncharacterized protein n=1 Tax=Meripilus lineatus TaxID=2056292 RepID=A0AAD5UXJ2_9APHY|nr:hypothetical protein NLI96_g8294 [Physisporinus lineatus]
MDPSGDSYDMDRLILPRLKSREERRSSRTPRAYRSLSKTFLLIVLSSIHLISNAYILFASFHGIRFGQRIAKDTWRIGDPTLLTCVSFASKLLFIGTTTSGGWAISLLWSRRLIHRVPTAGLAELQSLTIFQSATSIFQSVQHLVSRQYVSSQWLYCVIVVFAILLQFYTTAVITLVTPSIFPTTHLSLNFSFQPLPYMASPVFGNRCSGFSLSNNASESCLGMALAGSALSDAETFSQHAPPIELGSQSWVMANTNFQAPSALIGAALPIGPVNGVDFSSGVALYGVNTATVVGILSLDAAYDYIDPNHVLDSIEFEIWVNTTTPQINCTCGPGDVDDEDVVIRGISYNVDEIPSLGPGEVVGQVTSDDMYLILSFGGSTTTSPLTHCAVQLNFVHMETAITGGLSSVSFLSYSVVVYPVVRNASELTLGLRFGEQQSLKAFSDVWLQGLGWSKQPSKSPAAAFLGEVPIGTDNARSETGVYLEHHILMMLANGISAGFSKETIDDSNLDKPENRTFNLTKWEYVTQVSSKWQYLFVFIIILDSVFVLGCAGVVLAYGWYPQWTDPVTLLRVALCSSVPVSRSDEHDALHSPVFYTNEEEVGSSLWKDRYSLVEVAEGPRRYLAFDIEPGATRRSMTGYYPIDS